jgi:tetratricopeptide (TPR) repeat protein
VADEKDYTARVAWPELNINERWKQVNAFAGAIFGNRYAMLKGLSSKGKMKVYVFRYDKRDEQDANRKYNYYILEGNKLMLLGNYPRAVHSYSNAVDYAPGDADAHNRLGYSLMATGQYTKGIEEALKARELDPLTSNLIWYSPVPPNQDAEISQISAQIEASPSAELYNSRGALYFHARRYNEAISDFNKSIALNPLLADARNNLGGALIKTGDFAGAVKTCNVAISISRQTSAVNLQAARQAIALLETAKKDPSVKAYTELGIYFYQLDLFEDARESFLKAEQLDQTATIIAAG